MTVDPSVLALASLVVAAIAAIASPVTSLLVARARNEHERQLASTERRQRRRETAYREVVPYLLRTRDAAARTQPMWERTGDPGPPEPLGEDDLRRIETEVALHGSPAVLDNLLAIADLGRSFYANVETYRAMRVTQDRTEWEPMEASRRELFETIRGTLRLINEELGTE